MALFSHETKCLPCADYVRKRKNRVVFFHFLLCVIKSYCRDICIMSLYTGCNYLFLSVFFFLSSTYEFEPREPSQATRAQINRAT
jgi:hypothetical protein